MNSSETIRAKVVLPCSIRLSGSEIRVARGVTEELNRESLILVTSSTSDSRWLKAAANVLIVVELPFAGTFEPRVLECKASISRVRTFSKGVRVVATVQRMAFINRDHGAGTGRSVKHSCTAGGFPRSQGRK